MKIYALVITTKTCRLATAFDLNSFGYFQRSTVKEYMLFFSRTLLDRTECGQRQSVVAQEYQCHVYVRSDGLGAIAICDSEYPQRVAFAGLNTLLQEFHELYGETWPLMSKDSELVFPLLDQAIIEWQHPAKADKLTKIHEDLDKTIEVVHRTIDAVLDRGVKLDELVKRSEDLGVQAKLFYKASANNNRCCTIN